MAHETTYEYRYMYLNYGTTEPIDARWGHGSGVWGAFIPGLKMARRPWRMGDLGGRLSACLAPLVLLVVLRAA